MRCIKCGKIKNGITINAVNDKYRICVDCIKTIDIPIKIEKDVFKSKISQQRYETKVKKDYLQKLVDEKLWEYMR